MLATSSSTNTTLATLGPTISLSRQYRKRSQMLPTRAALTGNARGHPDTYPVKLPAARRTPRSRRRQRCPWCRVDQRYDRVQRGHHQHDGHACKPHQEFAIEHPATSRNRLTPGGRSGSTEQSVLFTLRCVQRVLGLSSSTRQFLFGRLQCVGVSCRRR